MRKRTCDYEGCFHEQTISLTEWRALLRHARELDINKGAFYDARAAAVNFWCGPENKPGDWPDKIERTLLKHRRDYVGAVFADLTRRREIKLHFDVRAYSRARHITNSTRKPWNLINGTPKDRQWILSQFEMLRHHVRLMGQGEIGRT
jgi:hypothetical protein